MLYFLQLSSDDSNISNNAQGQGHVKVEAVQALHLEAYRLVVLVIRRLLALKFPSINP